MESKNNDTNEFISKTERDSQTLKTNLWLPKRIARLVGEEINEESGMNIHTLPYI